MAEAREVRTVWTTDRGLRSWSVWEEEPADLLGLVRWAAETLEGKGVYLVRLLRVHTRTAPMVGAEPSWVLASPWQRVPEGLFRVTQEMLS